MVLNLASSPAEGRQPLQYGLELQAFTKRNHWQAKVHKAIHVLPHKPTGVQLAGDKFGTLIWRPNANRLPQ